MTGPGSSPSTDTRQDDQKRCADDAWSLSELIRCAPVRENARGELCSMIPVEAAARIRELLDGTTEPTTVDEPRPEPCPACSGRGKTLNEIAIYMGCAFCGGTGRRP